MYVTKQNLSTAGAISNGITSTSCAAEAIRYTFGSKFRESASGGGTFFKVGEHSGMSKKL